MKRNPNDLDIEEKKKYLDTFKDIDFDSSFGMRSLYSDSIHEITFSNDKAFIFVFVK